MDTLEPIMEPVSVPRMMSGTAIIDDVCLRLANQLARDCNLRGSDCYRSYSARVRVDLWVNDIDTTEISADVQVGPVESAPSTQTVSMGIGAAADQVAGAIPQSLERFIDDGGAQVREKEPRTYVSRIRNRK